MNNKTYVCPLFQHLMLNYCASQLNDAKLEDFFSTTALTKILAEILKNLIAFIAKKQKFMKMGCIF